MTTATTAATKKKAAPKKAPKRATAKKATAKKPVAKKAPKKAPAKKKAVPKDADTAIRGEGQQEVLDSMAKMKAFTEQTAVDREEWQGKLKKATLNDRLACRRKGLTAGTSIDGVKRVYLTPEGKALVSK